MERYLANVFVHVEELWRRHWHRMRASIAVTLADPDDGDEGDHPLELKLTMATISIRSLGDFG